MKFKIGDKVKYDSEEWLLYGTVNAIFEQSISPCYRINVDKMIKKSCNLSITQFEFELEEVEEGDDNVIEKRKWENTEVEYLKKYYGVLSNEDLGKMLRRTPKAIDEKGRKVRFEQAQKQERGQEQVASSPSTIIDNESIEPVELITAPAKRRGGRPKKIEQPQIKKRAGRPKKEQAAAITLSAAEKIEVAPKAELTEPEVKKKRGGRPKKIQTQQIEKKIPAWYINFEKYKSGEKSNVISAWAAQNRKEYKSGKLKEKKLDLLIGTNFPFEIVPKKKRIVGT